MKQKSVREHVFNTFSPLIDFIHFNIHLNNLKKRVSNNQSDKINKIIIETCCNKYLMFSLPQFLPLILRFYR